MTQFTFTVKEAEAARILVQSCLSAMGGKRPADLEYDEFTWIDIKDLMAKGKSRHEAAGLFSALADKGFIGEYNPGEWIVNTEGWKFMDTIWDQEVAA